jgi:hypothetical protein
LTVPLIVARVEATFVAVPVVTVGLETEATFVAVPTVTVDLGAETIFVATPAVTIGFAEGAIRVLVLPGTTLVATSCGEKGVVNVLSRPLAGPFTLDAMSL